MVPLETAVSAVSTGQHNTDRADTAICETNPPQQPGPRGAGVRVEVGCTTSSSGVIK